MIRLKLTRHLRIVFVAACGFTCLSLIVLRMRSDFVEDRASGHVNGVGVRLYSSRGWIVCTKNNLAVTQNYPWSMQLGGDYWLDPTDDRMRFSFSFNFFQNSNFASMSVPHSLPILSIAALGIVAAFGQMRFSLRTLLIFMTCVALVLGLTLPFR
jgi:hypothetical protein